MGVGDELQVLMGESNNGSSGERVGGQGRSPRKYFPIMPCNSAGNARFEYKYASFLRRKRQIKPAQIVFMLVSSVWNFSVLCYTLVRFKSQ